MRYRTRILTLIGLLFSSISIASAHHAMGGVTPGTSTQGFLSGLGHPLIDVEHLAFIVAAALMLGFVRQRRALPLLAFLGATLVGAMAYLGGLQLPMEQTAIAASILLAGLWLFSQQRAPSWSLALFFAIAGLLHGNVYAVSIIGAEPTPLIAYLVGFTVVQGLVMVAIATGVTMAERFSHAATRKTAQVSGLALIVIGFLLV